MLESEGGRKILSKLQKKRTEGKWPDKHKQAEDEVLAVGNDIVDQHSTPQSLMEDDPVAIQEKSWRDVICPFPKHKGKKLGEIASVDADYLSYFAGKVETIENTELADALIEFLKESNNNGRQGFGRVG